MSNLQYIPKDVGSLISTMVQNGHNPAATVRVMYDHLQEITNGQYGEGLTKASHPFGFILEGCAAMVASGILKSINNTKYNNLTLAADVQDLYRFMNDEDAIGIHAKPSVAEFTVLVNHDQLILEIPQDPIEDYKQMTIPMGTQVTINDVIFLFEYDIFIRLYPNGILEVLTSKHRSTLEHAPFVSDIIKSYVVRDTDNVNWLQFNIPLRNLAIVTSHHDAQRSEVFDINVEYNNDYHNAKVYYEDDNGDWIDLPVYYHEEAIDPTTPCIIAKIYESTIGFYIPPIYTSSGIINGRIRVDIYETQGDIRLHLTDFSRTGYSYELITILDTVDTHYTNPLTNVTLHMFSVDITKYGRSQKTFDELKNTLIHNSTGPNKLPIHHKQVEIMLNDRRYDMIVDTDTITRRVFFATRKIPDVIYNKYLRTPGNISLETIIVNLEYLVEDEQFYIHDKRITIPPDILYEHVNGQTIIIPKQERLELLALPKDTLVQTVSDRTFMFSPFYYIVDMTRDTFYLRPYRLDKPKSYQINHVVHNTTTDLTVFTNQHVLEKTSNGYKLTLYTIGDDPYKALPLSVCGCQLRLKTPSGTIAYLSATGVGVDADDNKVFEVLINTTYDIDSKHLLYLTNALNAGIARDSIGINLDNEVEIYYTTTTASPTYIKSLEDDDISRLIVPQNSIVIMKETLQLHFGLFLKHLWRKIKGFPLISEPLLHKTDRLYYYRENIYDRVPSTASIFEFKDSCGGVDYKLIACKGQAIRDMDGRVIYEYRKGDIVRDSLGRPQMYVVNKYVRHLAITMIEGEFYFASQDSAMNHKEDIIEYITEWTEEMKEVQESLLANHTIYYHPSSTIKSLKVYTEDDVSLPISGQQSLEFTLHVRQDVYNDEGIRAELSRRTVEITSKWVVGVVLAISDLIELLKRAYGKAVINVEVKGLGGNKNLRVLTIDSKSDRLSLKKKLFVKSDKLIVTEDVTIKFSLVR